MLYPVLMVAGFAGLIAVAILGFAHAPKLHKAPHAPAHTPGGAGGHHAPGAPQGARAAAPGKAAAPQAGAGHHVSLLNRGITWLAPLISPLTWFSWMFGAGAAGTVAELFNLPEIPVIAIAAIGALAFQLGIVRPVWNLVFRFESTPAGNLGACLLQEVEAITSFNARGEGLVRVVVDGRSEDVLARLVEAERDRESRPKRGDRLVIQEVDSSSNTCLVSRS